MNFAYACYSLVGLEGKVKELELHALCLWQTLGRIVGEGSVTGSATTWSSRGFQKTMPLISLLFPVLRQIFKASKATSVTFLGANG